MGSTRVITTRIVRHDRRRLRANNIMIRHNGIDFLHHTSRTIRGILLLAQYITTSRNVSTIIPPHGLSMRLARYRMTIIPRFRQPIPTTTVTGRRRVRTVNFSTHLKNHYLVVGQLRFTIVSRRRFSPEIVMRRRHHITFVSVIRHCDTNYTNTRNHRTRLGDH